MAFWEVVVVLGVVRARDSVKESFLDFAFFEERVLVAILIPIVADLSLSRYI